MAQTGSREDPHREGESVMREYVIFKYQVEGQDYVEAYPIHSESVRGLIMFGSLEMTYSGEWGMVTSESRNQARKAAYINWIDWTAKGFNHFPISLPHVLHDQYVVSV